MINQYLIEVDEVVQVGAMSYAERVARKAFKYGLIVVLFQFLAYVLIGLLWLWIVYAMWKLGD